MSLSSNRRSSSTNFATLSATNSQRAQRFQDDALFEHNEQSFALYLRYQTTNDRAFHKCLRELATLRRERQQFESQNGKQSGTVYHNVR